MDDRYPMNDWKCRWRIINPTAFYKADDCLWFMQMKAAFSISGKMDEQTKFEFLAQYAEPELLPTIAPIDGDPARMNSYQAIKS